jgi:ATP-dependent Clp protease ATP-binding subunit ClpA
LPAATALTRLGISLQAARRALEAVNPVAAAVTRDRKAKPRLSPEAQGVLERSLHEARRRGHRRLGAEHLLLALLHDAGCEAVDVLRRLGVTPSNVHAQLGVTPS